MKAGRAARALKQWPGGCYITHDETRRERKRELPLHYSAGVPELNIPTSHILHNSLSLSISLTYTLIPTHTPNHTPYWDPDYSLSTVKIGVRSSTSLVLCSPADIAIIS